MSFPRRPARLLLTAALAAAAGLAVPGTGGAAPAAAPGAADLHDAPGTVHIANAGSGKCLDPVTEGVLPGQAVLQQDCRNARSQEWIFAEVAPRTDSLRVYVIVNNNSRLCLQEAVPGAGNGSLVDQDACTNVAAQWVLVNDFGVIHLQNTADSRCLDLENGDPSAGRAMQVWDCNFSTNNQKWRQL